MYSRIKLSAKYAVQGSYLKFSFVIFLLILLFACFFICDALVERYGTGIGIFNRITAFILAFLVLAAFDYRLQIKHLMLARKSRIGKGETELKGIFKACVLKTFLVFIKLFWYAFFEAVPFISALVFVRYCRYNSVSLNASYAVLIGISVLAAGGLVFCFVYVQRYSRAVFYLACYKEFTPADAIRESVRKTRGRLSEILFLKLSFLPWFLLCIGVLPAFYVVPYYKQSLTCYWMSR